MGKLNPQICTVEVGIKSLREVTIFPLSLADQAKTARILSKAFQEVMGKLASFEEEDESSDKDDLVSMAKQLSDIDIMEFVLSAIQENLEVILKLVVDNEEKISMEELTNEQFYELVKIIYEVNYENASKNFPALWKRAMGMVSGKVAPEKNPRRKVSHSTKPSPGSAVGTTID